MSAGGAADAQQQLLAGDEDARGSVDWQLVEEELREVPDEYKEPRFYPLKHVVEMFSSGDPQRQTVALRDRESRLSDMVDMVVEGYHVGFARSIQNYSQILALFQDARQQIDNMKKATNDSIRQLAAHSRNLSEQWRRDTPAGRMALRLLFSMRDAMATGGLGVARSVGEVLAPRPNDSHSISPQAAPAQQSPWRCAAHGRMISSCPAAARWPGPGMRCGDGARVGGDVRRAWARVDLSSTAGRES